MILKFFIGLLMFDGVAAVLFWLLIAHDAKTADRKIEGAYKSRDHALDDTQNHPSD